jgi:hypothetical protein
MRAWGEIEDSSGGAVGIAIAPAAGASIGNGVSAAGADE